MIESDNDVIASWTADHAVQDICLGMAEVLKRDLTEEEKNTIVIKVKFWFVVAHRKGRLEVDRRIRELGT